jgi:DNA-binding response OmpR family regulator
MSATILIVDDEADLATSCARLLRRHGWRVETATTRDAALAVVEGAHPPALAIVDRKLPDGDGLDVLRAAQETGMPVIMVTGFTSAGSRQRALDEGAAGFLGKPFSGKALLELVSSIVGEPAYAAR